MATHNEKNHDDKKAALLEALRQNWESARYHESARWKYTYAYYAALGVILFYLVNQEKLSNILKDPLMIFFLFVLFSFLALGGAASFFHLLHANMEYKNYIRAIEFIARDLKLNKNITEYRKGEIDVKRSAYMALPLLLKIRKGASFKNLTIIGIFISVTMSLSSILFFPASLFVKQLKQFPAQYCIASLILIFSSLIAFAISYLLHKFWGKIEYEAEVELDIRDPSNLEGKGSW